MMACLDVQGFWSQGNFIVKEFGLVDMKCTQTELYLFKPPFPSSMLSAKDVVTNNWLTRNYHHLEWESGFLEYDEFTSKMNSIGNRYDVLYVKGEQKRNFISSFVPDKCIVVNLDTKDCPSLRLLARWSTAYTCPLVHPFCAMSDAFRLCMWMSASYYRDYFTDEIMQWQEKIIVADEQRNHPDNNKGVVDEKSDLTDRNIADEK